MRKVLVSFCALLLVIGAASSVQAASVPSRPLSDLFAGQSIAAGDKVFSDWSLDFTNSTDPALDPDLSLINVTPLVDQPNNPGLRFDAGNQLSIVDSVMGFDFIDLTFSFTVTSKGNPIIGNSLKITGSSIAGSDMFSDPLIGITEEVFDMASNMLASKSVEVSFMNDKPFDSAEFVPQSEILVKKNILISAAAPGDTAKLCSFEQRFSQVPEPSTMALIGTALFGLVGLRRKFKK